MLKLLPLLAVQATCRLRSLVACLSLLQQQIGDVLVDSRFLPRQRPALRGEVAILLASLQELSSCSLAQLCLLHPQIAQLATGLHAQLRLLPAQLTNTLASLHLTLLLLLKGIHSLSLGLGVAL